jgi:hypothetical protein
MVACLVVETEELETNTHAHTKQGFAALATFYFGRKNVRLPFLAWAKGEGIGTKRECHE